MAIINKKEKELIAGRRIQKKKGNRGPSSRQPSLFLSFFCVAIEDEANGRHTKEKEKFTWLAYQRNAFVIFSWAPKDFLFF